MSPSPHAPVEISAAQRFAYSEQRARAGRILDEFVQENQKVAAVLEQSFLIMKLNYSEENRNKEFLADYPKVPAYPHLFVLDSDGTFLHSQGTAELEKGRSYDEEVFLEFLTRWWPSDSKDVEASLNSAKEERIDAEEVPSMGVESARAEKKLVQKSAPALHRADYANEAKLLQLGDRRLRHRGSVRLVRYSPDGKMIASSGTNHDTGIHLWDSATGRHVRHLNRARRVPGK